jgi:putative membrane protein
MMFHGFGPGIGPVMPVLGGWGWQGVVALICTIVLFVIIIGFIVFAISKMGRHGHMLHSTMNHDALDIAKERYAKGEIDEEEFNKIKQNLS